MAIAKTSRLEAVNTMLSVIGEAPVNDLTSSSATADVIMAVNVLDEVSREIQTHGWHFNRETLVQFVPNESNEIVLSPSIAEVDIEPLESGNKEYVQRGGRLYNKTDHTFTIPNQLKATVVYVLDWDDLPQAARNYFMIRASRKFQDRVVGSEKHHSFNQQDEYQALVALKAAEARTGDFTIFDNYDVSRLLDRGNVFNRITT
tara:strand:- start:7 stop:615 length:609 start_codon:yes stop_codon:yes gene_type:complete